MAKASRQALTGYLVCMVGHVFLKSLGAGESPSPTLPVYPVAWRNWSKCRTIAFHGYTDLVAFFQAERLPNLAWERDLRLP